MPTETRYFRSDTHTVNGLTAFKLGTTNTTIHSTSSTSITVTAYIGIRVWKRSSDGVETEITGGLCVALAPVPVASTYQLVTGQWLCPTVTLAPTDSIVVRVYACDSAGGNQQILSGCNFSTEQLGAGSLNQSQWTVYYCCFALIAAGTYLVFFAFGSSTYPTRIEGFAWSEYVPPPPVIVKIPIMDGLIYVEG